ncbi:MAG: glycosyltransferase family 2 protein [Pseudohaliea sp.]
MKLVIQIPCLNEADTLPQTLADLPRSVAGFDSLEVLVIDDGSTDETARVALEHGATRVVRHKYNQGLAASFQTGMETALRMGADIIVNTDGDNQYCGADIPCLVEPIIDGRADIVIGDRQVSRKRQFGPVKTWLQGLGSSVVSSLAGAEIADAVSGFRALSREAALRLTILSRFSYTTEMIIQAGNKRLKLESVPVRTNTVTRPPRLFKSTPWFIALQATTMIRMYAMYRPMRFFFMLGAVVSASGLLPVLRFLYFYVVGSGAGHVQSLVLGGVLLILGFMLFVTGLLSDLISQNRKLLESGLERIRRMELERVLESELPSAATPASRKTEAPAPGAGRPGETQSG